MSEPQTTETETETAAAPVETGGGPRGPRGPRTEEQKALMEQNVKAKATVVAYMEKASARIPKDVMDALKLLGFRHPKRRGRSGEGITSITDQLVEIEAMLINGPVSHMEFYTKFRLGPTDMKSRIRVFLQTRSGTQRPWIALDNNKDSETFDHYKIIARGDEIPEGWDAYIPPDIQEKIDAAKAAADAQEAKTAETAEAAEA